MAGIVFGVFCVVSVVSAVITGNLALLGDALFSGAEDAVELMLSLGGAMCLWSGLLSVLEEIGVLAWLERLTAPLLSRLFPDLPNGDGGSSGLSEITASLCANLLGIGNAATPIGLRAMAHLRQHRADPNRMSNAEILFVVMNTAPPTLLPTTLLTMRHAAGSRNPTAPLPVIWLVSMLGFMFSVLAVYAMMRTGARAQRRHRV